VSASNIEIQAAFKIDDEAAMIALGGDIAGALLPQMIITLKGGLGAGKTTLSRGLLQSLGHKGAVKSPTYTLVEPYELEIGTVFHFDLYRVIDPEELDYIGFADYLSQGSLSLIEWPERGDGYLSEADLSVDIEQHRIGREVTVMARTSIGKDFLIRLAKITGCDLSHS
jgi:tRNA threonylcarbamoyladenosine biosynthesis protein TsaE